MIGKIFQKIFLVFSIILLLFGLFFANVYLVAHDFLERSSKLNEIVQKNIGSIIDERFDEIKKGYGENLTISKEELKSMAYDSIKTEIDSANDFIKSFKFYSRLLGWASIFAIILGIILSILGTFSILSSMRKIGFVGVIATLLSSGVYFALKYIFYSIVQGLNLANYGVNAGIARDFGERMLDATLNPALDYGVILSVIAILIFLAMIIIPYLAINILGKE